ncbi:PREDICTED: 39S ribosomal protein L2, mitochondrial [Nicrophorus vespilloides]|uniref:39S ribosomal protein L2, mitochondrial n=1 Tax=Nicrophorus vespilloides TaxID=110193 RepID=A0ABM1NFM9_NICVS|nr:PREDICTED: 39S ribosomal protein L2, mitochondrial [Nicrophorus vespilloides]
MGTLTRALQRLCISELSAAPKLIIPVRHRKYVEKPTPGLGISYRRIVHYPEEYTVKPLDVTNLGGRDPVSGRLVAKGIGGGIKHKFHWVQWKREGPKEGPPKVEKVVKIIVDGCRTSHIALIAHENELKYYLATENMKPGDLIRTSMHIPRIPVRAYEGDSYPLGALSIGTQINSVEKYPGLGGFLVHAAGAYATIVRKAPNNRVVIQLPSKREFALPEGCMCTVGKLSNAIHGSTPIGSAQRNRELGNRPRSGLWQRKSGKHGRKIRRLPPVKEITSGNNKKQEIIKLSLDGIHC